MNITSGNNNIVIGNSAGFNLTTGDNNIDIGSLGFAGDSSTIRIGTDALQIATFQSAARTQQALLDLRNAGYRAYSVELSSTSGERLLAVLLGPYADLASAEHDLESVRQLPDYGDARVVQAVPPLLPPDARP